MKRNLTPWFSLGRLSVRLELKTADLWVGAYFAGNEAWVCLIPCLPLHFVLGGGK